MNKLVQINSVVNSGSTGRIAEEIGKKARINGWESYIYYGRYGNNSESVTLKIGGRLNPYLHLLESRILDNHGLASRLATKTVIEILKHTRPNIVHLHNIHGYYLNYKLLFQYLSTQKVPVVWTLHDCWPITGHCSYFDLIGCEKWKIECSSCPQKYEYPTSYLLDKSKRNYYIKKESFNGLLNLTLVPVSNWLNNLLKESFLKNIPTKVIHNGIDLNVFKPINTNSIRNRHNLKDKFIILGVANNWHDRKGFSDFLKISKALNRDEIIILIGLKESQLNLLPKNIIGITKTENVEGLCEFYSCADVFANPTYEDNYPTVNLEAMACGTPVVTYNTGGSPESLNEKTGYVAEKGNIDDLLNLVREVKVKGKKQYSIYCREHALDNFCKEKAYNQYLSLYDSIQT